MGLEQGRLLALHCANGVVSYGQRGTALKAEDATRGAVVSARVPVGTPVALRTVVFRFSGPHACVADPGSVGALLDYFVPRPYKVECFSPLVASVLRLDELPLRCAPNDQRRLPGRTAQMGMGSLDDPGQTVRIQNLLWRLRHPASDAAGRERSGNEGKHPLHDRIAHCHSARS
jgi:hypothetical protein